MKLPFVILSRKKHFSLSSELEGWKGCFHSSQSAMKELKEKFDTMKGNLEGIIEMDKRGYETQLKAAKGKIIQQQDEIKELNVQIRNFIAGAQDLQRELLSQKAIIDSQKTELKEQEKIMNQQKQIPVSQVDSEKDEQIKNLKIKIGELEKEIEVQKQITFQRNQELNKLKGK